jgi:hypothetical protein
MTEQKFLRLSLEAVDSDSLGESDRLRLTVEGSAETIHLLAELVIAASGGEVTKATSFTGGAEQDITALFKAPTRLDALSTGDGA